MKPLKQHELENAETFLRCYEQDLQLAKKSLRAYEKIDGRNGISIYKSRVADLQDSIRQLKEYL